MEKSKKQRQDKQLKMSLKTYLDLYPHLFSQEKTSQLARIYPQIASINSLRIFALIEILYLLQLCINILQKKNINIGEFKIGIIGGGITARLILNCILPLAKDGLSLKNITVSTRQTENFDVYVQNFGIKTVFDNEAIAKESDFLIICTPATLDNWIVSDLKAPLNQRVNGLDLKQQGKLTSKINKLINQKSQIGNNSNLSLANDNQKLANSLQMSGSLQLPKIQQRFMKPLVYILTSDFTQQKCARFFDFPVLTPSIRNKDLKSISQKLQKVKGDTIQAHQKVLSEWLISQNSQQRVLDSREGNSLESYGQSEIQVRLSKYYGTRFLRIIRALNYAFGNPLNIASLGSSLSITVSINQSTTGKKKDETMFQILDSATISGQFQETFLKKCRKWRMVHNNFIA